MPAARTKARKQSSLLATRKITGDPSSDFSCTLVRVAGRFSNV